MLRAAHPTDVPGDASSQDDGLIALMSETLANQIAAGEVVQRPASVAKELMENALDAGASSVTLLVKTAGSSLVQVIDDGCGMHAADAPRSFERHATSKLKHIDDLAALHTYGFRGEALASVGSVAQVELRTKRRTDALGTLVRVDGGTLVEVAPCATAEGTSVAVRNLFYNVPARRNFLKAPATEFKHLVETFQRMALANPQVAFTLVQDDHEVFSLPGSDAPFLDALPVRLAGLLGAEHRAHLILVDETTSYLSVRGVLGDPSLFKKSRGEQFLFINGRAVKDRSLDYAARAAYEALLPDRRYPTYALFVDIDPKHVDVNVHPQKSEVKFDDERGVFAFVKAAVKRALAVHLVAPEAEASTPTLDLPETTLSRRPRPLALRTGTGADDRAGGETSSRSSSGGVSGHFASSATRHMDGLEAAARLYQGDLSDAAEGARSAEVERASPSAPAGGLTVVEPAGATAPPADQAEIGATWLLGDRYIGAALRGAILVVDAPHAHQRIVYERAVRTAEHEVGATQHLLFPLTLELDAAGHALVTEALAEFAALGFELEPFSGRAFVLRGVPPDVRSGEERRVVLDLVGHLKHDGGLPRSERTKAMARMLARHAALRDATGLDDQARRSLIADLFACAMPYATPSGKATCFRLTLDEVASRLG